MRLNEENSISKGQVSFALIDRKTGRMVNRPRVVHNVVTYNAADILAQLITGNVNYVPKKVGYIYGPLAATPTDPGSNRDQTWSIIAQDVQQINGNMILSNLGARPIILPDGPTGRYEGNAVTLNAVSDSNSDLVFSGAGYSAVKPTAGSDKYFQVVLLAEVYGPGQIVPTYVPYARSALGTGIDVAADTELAVYWTQTFK